MRKRKFSGAINSLTYRNLLLLFFALSVTLLLSAEGEVHNSLELTAEERSWLDAHPVIKIGPDPDFPPVEFFDEKGQYRGLAAEYLEQIEFLLGIRFEIVRLKDWAECIEKARSREIDMFGAATKTSQRSEYMSFSQHYLEFPAVIIVEENLKQNLALDRMTGMKIAVVSGYAFHDYLSLLYPDLDLHPVEDIETGLMNVSFGVADAFVGNIATTTYAIEKGGISNLRFAGKTDFSYNLSFAIRKDWPELEQIFNKALSGISGKKKQDIYQKWIHIDQMSLLENRNFLIVIFSGSVALIVIFTLILLWNHSLKMLVSARTKELNEELKERKRTVELLEDSEHKFRTLVNNIPGAVYRCLADEMFTMILISPAIEKISGYPPSDFIDKGIRNYKSLIVREDRKAGREAISESLSLREPYLLEYRIKHKNGTIRHVYEKGQGIFSDNGELLYFDGVLFDFTEHRKVEEQLRQTQKMDTVGILASGFAHDFNNVLGGITATVSMMSHKIRRKGSIDSDKLIEYIDMLQDCGERASNIVQHLLSLSRSQDSFFKSADLNNIIKSVLKICEITFDKSIVLTSLYSAGPARALIDVTQIEQVLLNLCVNAEHSMTIMRAENQEWGGELIVSLEKIAAGHVFCKSHPDAVEGPYWIISVKDSGIGMDRATVSKIFNPFFTTKEKGKGLGLGLSMVYNIIKTHNGFIDIYSEPGEGSAFNIYLPVDIHSDSDEEGVQVKDIPTGSGRILIVDDEKIMRWSAKEILSECGYDLITADNGQNAVDIYRKEYHSIRAVLLDMVMPDMSGRKTYEILKSINPEVKVLLASGFRKDKRVKEVLAMGVNGFIQKPYTLEKLAGAISNILN